LEILDQTDSTNAHLMREASAGAPSGPVCLAEHQTAGRGRRGRVWVSPFGANLYLSVLWRYPIAPAQLGGLSLAAGTAVAAALHETGAEGLALKWPNDVLWGRRKLAGLLLEVAGEAQGPIHLVVGVGVNLHMEPAQGEAIDQPWTDLSAVLGGRRYGRNRLAAAVIEALIATLDLFGREGLNPFLEKWNRFDGFRGESVRVVLGDRVTEGVHAGIAGDGALLLETSDGVRRFQAGEVSLRANGEPRP
jgi:BirA family biotin operon repressor/biotin-[acetyl-CoA-carboxylase] ligase